MNMRGHQALRRLGRYWNYPDEPLFKEEWFAGRVPSCLRCKMPVVMHVAIGEPMPEVHCERCDDELLLDAKDDYYDMVLVDEEWGFGSWAWYPGMKDAELEHLWKQIPRIPYGRDLDDWLPGDWLRLTFTGLHDTLDDLRKNGERWYRFAHIHTDDDSFLSLPTRRHHEHPEWRTYERTSFYHLGAPKRRLRRQR
jgi:hypothetical protein